MHFQFAQNNMSINEDYCVRKASNESADQDVISLYYEGDLITGEKKSCESMSSIDEYLSKQTGSEQFDEYFQNLRANGSSYSMALKDTMRVCSAGAGDITMDSIVKWILHPDNDNISVFLDELKQILSKGYKFNGIMINRLMDYCVNNFNVNFHQFVLTKIINKMPNDELDLLNQEILVEFVNSRLESVKARRMGLSRKIAKSTHG